MTMDFTQYSNAWGPLGNPTKEQINEWCNLPAGKFTALVKERTKKKKGKVLSEHIVHVTKELYNSYSCTVKIMAYDYNDAMIKTRTLDTKTLEFDSIPYRTNKERFCFSSVPPSKCT